LFFGVGSGCAVAKQMVKTNTPINQISGTEFKGEIERVMSREWVVGEGKKQDPSPYLWGELSDPSRRPTHPPPIQEEYKREVLRNAWRVDKARVVGAATQQPKNFFFLKMKKEKETTPVRGGVWITDLPRFVPNIQWISNANKKN